MGAQLPPDVMPLHSTHTLACVQVVHCSIIHVDE